MKEKQTDNSGFVRIGRQGGPVELEYVRVGPLPSPGAPVVVFLHEGLGSVSMWRDFPQRFCETHGLAGVAFSRFGYGRSTPRPRDQALMPDYLQRQAHDALPAFLAALGIERPWLFGHSDGGSIALLYAARFPQAVSGIVVAAPHIFVEDITIAGIRAVREAYESTAGEPGGLRQRLARHHADVDSVFYGWNDAWLNPAFRAWNIEDELPRIACPILALQGERDEYGTLEQIHGIARRNPRTAVHALPDCSHSPHRDAPDMLIALAGDFMRKQQTA